MSSQVVLVQKFGHNWGYLIGHEYRALTVERGSLLEQFISIIDQIRDAHDFHDEHFILCSSVLVREVVPHLTSIFPLVTFVPIRDTGVMQVFRRVMEYANASRPTRGSRAKNTLYVCSDASYGQTAGLSGWAWVSNHGGVPDYNFGVSEQSSIVHAELEGILHAIVENRKKKVSTIHVYCDSQSSVAWADEILHGSFKKLDAVTRSLSKRTQALALQAREIATEKNIRIEWVRGHKAHRLNVGADYLSREARRAASRWERLDADAPHVLAVLEVVSR